MWWFSSHFVLQWRVCLKRVRFHWIKELSWKDCLWQQQELFHLSPPCLQIKHFTEVISEYFTATQREHHDLVALYKGFTCLWSASVPWGLLKIWDSESSYHMVISSVQHWKYRLGGRCDWIKSAAESSGPSIPLILSNCVSELARGFRKAARRCATTTGLWVKHVKPSNSCPASVFRASGEGSMCFGKAWKHKAKLCFHTMHIKRSNVIFIFILHKPPLRLFLLACPFKANDFIIC